MKSVLSMGFLRNPPIWQILSLLEETIQLLGRLSLTAESE